MTDDNTGTVAVVKPYYLLEEAYRMGHSEFEGMDEPNDDGDMDLSPFKSSARWANIIAPDLRAMAGYDDGGHGTYKLQRQVAAIHAGCEEDEPAEADLMHCGWIYDKLVEAWDMGALDGWEGTYDPDSVQNWI